MNRYAAMVVTGAGLIAAGLTGPVLPLFKGYSVSSAHSVCSSGLGQLAQALSHPAVTTCQEVGVLYDLGHVTVLAGAALIIAGIALRYRSNTYGPAQTRRDG